MRGTSQRGAVHSAAAMNESTSATASSAAIGSKPPLGMTDTWAWVCGSRGRPREPPVDTLLSRWTKVLLQITEPEVGRQHAGFPSCLDWGEHKDPEHRAGGQ